MVNCLILIKNALVCPSSPTSTASATSTAIVPRSGAFFASRLSPPRLSPTFQSDCAPPVVVVAFASL